MRILILMLFLLVGCQGTGRLFDSNNDRLFFGDRVIVLSGFYKGQEGVVVSYACNRLVLRTNGCSHVFDVYSRDCDKVEL